MSVWGRIKHDTESLEESGPSGGEDCNICCAATVSISFKPCGHVACKSCVDNLRRTNIFRADTGVKCPYCRSYVEAYEPLNIASSLTSELNEANLAARNAAIARGGKPQQPVQNVVVPIGHTSVVESWECSCGKLNTNFRDKCGKCAKPCSTTTGNRHVDKKDLLKCTADEILQLALEKMHPSLDKAFSDAGMPIGPASAIAGNSLLVGGTERTIMAAIQQPAKLERLRKVVKALVDNGHVHTLLIHWFGNYTLQDLVTASSKLRSVTRSILRQAQEQRKVSVSVDTLTSILTGKDDLLGALIRAIAKDAVEAAKHKQGTYALQKVLESPCNASEFVCLGTELLKEGRDLLGNEPGIYVMAKLVEQLSSAAATDMDNQAGEEASSLLDAVCELYHTGRATYLDGQRYEKLRYDMLISSLDGALPKQNAAVLAVQMASRALDITRKAAGRFVIKSLMVIPPVDSHCKEIMSNVCCHVADAFEQSVITTVLKTDDRPPHVMTVLTEQLNLYEEFDWLETLTAEMVEGAPLLKAHTEAMDILKGTLALSGLSNEFFESQLVELRKQLGNTSLFETAVRKLRTKNLAPPPPLFPAAAAAAPAAAASAADGITSQEYPPLGQEVARQNARQRAVQNGVQAPNRQPFTQQEPAPAQAAMAPPGSPQQEEIRRFAISGAIPDYISPEQLRLLQSGGALQGAKQGPPGFEQKDGAFGDSTANGIPGPSDAARQGLIAASPVRGAREAHQPALYIHPGTPPVGTTSAQERGNPLVFMVSRQAAAPPRPYMPPADVNLGFQGLPQASGRTSPVYSPRDHATGQAPQRPPVAAYMPHLAESAAPGVARPPPGVAGRPARPAQEYYNPPAARNGVSAAADTTEVYAAAADTDTWGNQTDLTDMLQQQSESRPFVPPPELEPIQQRQLHALAQKAGVAVAGHLPQQQQQRAAPVQARVAPTAVAAAVAPTSWKCPTCTFEHVGNEAGYLACAVCGSVRKD